MEEILSKWYTLFAEMAMDAQRHGLSVTVQKSKDAVRFQVSRESNRAEGRERRLPVKK